MTENLHKGLLILCTDKQQLISSSSLSLWCIVHRTRCT